VQHRTEIRSERPRESLLEHHAPGSNLETLPDSLPDRPGSSQCIAHSRGNSHFLERSAVREQRDSNDAVETRLGEFRFACPIAPGCARHGWRPELRRRLPELNPAPCPVAAHFAGSPRSQSREPSVESSLARWLEGSLARGLKRVAASAARAPPFSWSRRRSRKRRR
jgi:hypothetical protein